MASESPEAAGAGELVERLESDPACSRAAASTLRARSLVLEARSAHDEGDTDAALGACRAALVADPTMAGVDVLGARWLLDAGRRREALVWLGDALARHPDDDALQLLMLEALGVPTDVSGAARDRAGRARPMP